MSEEAGDEGLETPPGDTIPPGVETLLAELDDLAARVDPRTRETVQGTKRLLATAGERGLLPSDLRRLDSRDVAEALVGSVIFASPLLVEDGIFDIADHLFGFTISGVPVFLLANTAFVVLMTYALVEWTGRDRVETNRLFELIPVRVVMILVVSFLTATALMTIWGRVDDWRHPVEAVARVNVLWTVGSIGAALGDILSEDETPTPPVQAAMERRGAEIEEELSTTADDAFDEGALVSALHEQFDDLEEAVDGDPQAREVDRLRRLTNEAAADDLFGENIRKYTSRDVAEAFVGSVVFAIPFLVEDGVFDVAEYFLSFRVGGFPVFFLLNAIFVLAMVTALVYWTGPQDVVVTRPLFGVVPRRLVGIAIVSFLTAAALMTMWGRVGDWQNPVVAVARVSAVWTVASFGAALGDILPGESSGDDINEDLADLGEQVGEIVDFSD